MAEALALACLAGTLAFAVVRPRGLPEVVIAAPAALLLMATGVVSLDRAEGVLDDVGATVAFLAAVLALGELCARAGLFEAAGRWLAEGAGGRPAALLGLVVLLCAAVTAVLSLDATVVFLTPVVFATVGVLGARPRPHAYACIHLANSASLLLPVSNLSNLLAFHATGLSFARFGALMALPWSAAIAVEWLALRRRFRGDLAAPPTAARPAPDRGIPVAYTAAVLALTLAGFLASSWLEVDAALVAAGGVVLLAVPALARRRITPGGLARAADPAFLAFVVALAVIVAGAQAHGLGRLVDHVTPSGETFLALLAIAVVAAVLANLVNNLPAILLMLPVLAPQGAGPVLAALIGVNLGPNLTYVGSLATLLWRRVLTRNGMEARPLEFLRLGALTVPPALILAVSALWLSLQAGI
jgi:arsenical pump membrane protein